MKRAKTGSSAAAVRRAPRGAASAAIAPSRAAGRRRSRGFTARTEPRVGGRVLEAVTPSGTPVIVRPMPGFSKAYALLATRFGSLDAALPDGSALPVGLAHFLEHKMFATPDGDVFDLYAKRGASANAYTTFGHTAYLFSCTSQFEANLVTLLDTLGTMHADAAGIEREKGIIGQEIAMYQDDPSWRGYFGLLGALYRHHPIRLDVAGTAKTIAPIDRAVLLATHAAYYHPENLVLVVAGDVDPDVVLARATERLVSAARGAVHHRAAVPEPLAPASAEVRLPLSVSRPHVLLGWKDLPPGSTGAPLVRHEVETEIVLEALFGDGGAVEAGLYREGLVDESLEASSEAGLDFAFSVVSAEVDDVEAYRTRLLEAIDAVARRGLAAADVERCRRRAWGGWLRAFNSPERTASLHLGMTLKDARPEDALAALEGTTLARANARLRELVARPRAWSILLPRGA